MSTRYQTRRKILLGTVGLGVFLSWPRIASSQKKDLPAALADAKSESSALLAAIKKQPVRLGTGFKKEFATREFEISTNFSKTVFGVSNKDLKAYLFKDLPHLYDLYEKYGISLAQPPEEITKRNIFPKSHTTKNEVNSQNILITNNESASDLLIDVILDTFDLSEFKSVITEIFKNYAPARDLTDQFASALHLKDWEQLVRILFKFIDILTNPKSTLIPWVANKFGDKIKNRFIQKTLKVIAMRVLPFIGISLLAAGFIFSIKNNWDRIAIILNINSKPDQTS